MILNGVCVIWRGWIDLQRLDGMGYLEYDEERAQVIQQGLLLHIEGKVNEWSLAAERVTTSSLHQVMTLKVSCSEAALT